MRILENIFDAIKKTEMTSNAWVVGFLGIFSVRFLLEAFSSPSSSGIIPSDPQTFIHYLLFFLSTILTTACVVGFITKNYKEAVKIIFFGLPVIWIAPLIDILLSHGSGYKMAYIFDSHGKLLFDFFTFFGSSFTHGATIGIRVEIALILLLIGYYIWLNTKNIFSVIKAVLLSYVVGFGLATLPGIIYTLTHSSIGTQSEILNYFEKLVTTSNISHNTLHEGASSVSSLRFLELGFNKLMSQVLFMISFVSGGFLFWKMESKKFLAVIKNVRLERVNFYTSSLICGMAFAYINKLGNSFVWPDILSSLCLIIAWIALWMHAVHLNDVADIEIDKISNTNRPLVKNELNQVEMLQIGNLWLALALLGAWCAGFYPFFMSLIYIASAYIYSVPPLRLRRFPLVPSFLIAIACLATILSGFFFVSVHKELQIFPMMIVVGILIIVTLAINFKDLKDIEGDSANGIMTLATLFPKDGPRIIGLLLSLSILLTPYFLSFYQLYVFAIPASIVGYKLVVKKPYNEKPVFTLRFVFLFCIGLSYLAVYYFSGML